MTIHPITLDGQLYKKDTKGIHYHVLVRFMSHMFQKLPNFYMAIHGT